VLVDALCSANCPKEDTRMTQVDPKALQKSLKDAQAEISRLEGNLTQIDTVPEEFREAARYGTEQKLAAARIAADAAQAAIIGGKKDIILDPVAEAGKTAFTAMVGEFPETADTHRLYVAVYKDKETGEIIASKDFVNKTTRIGGRSTGPRENAPTFEFEGVTFTKGQNVRVVTGPDNVGSVYTSVYDAYHKLMPKTATGNDATVAGVDKALANLKAKGYALAPAA
jgi:hypothetical protein